MPPAGILLLVECTTIIDFRPDSTGAPFSAVFEAAAVDLATEGDEGIGATDTPVHPALFQPFADLQPPTTTPVDTHDPCSRNKG